MKDRVRIIDPREYRNETLIDSFRPIAQQTEDTLVTAQIVHAFRSGDPKENPTLSRWIDEYNKLAHGDKIAFGNALSSAARVWVSLGKDYATVGKLRELTTHELMSAPEIGLLRAQLIYGLFHR